MMLYSTALVASTATLLFSLTVNADLYSKDSPVLQLDGRSYDKLILQSNHTSIIEFYAPWCGHCKALQPAYEKAAKRLKGLAKVGVVNCDVETNKAFCGRMGVKGFPTLKIVRPGKKAGKPSVEDYVGERNVGSIVESVVDKIPNHVKRLNDKDVDGWLKGSNHSAKTILFTEKGTTSAMLRALAIDYLGSIKFAQVRNRETKTVERFGISSYPTFLLLPGGEKEAIVYDGELKKEAMSEFLKQVASPNPDPAPEAVKKKADKKAEKKTKPKDPEDSSEEKSDSSEPKDDAPPPPPPPPPPKEVRELSVIDDEVDLGEKCFSSKSRICLLALVHAKQEGALPYPIETMDALKNLAEVHEKLSRRQSVFPFYAVPATNPLAARLRKELELKDGEELEIIAVNARRAWWRRYPSADHKQSSIEDWIDVIRMNEGKRGKLPDSLLINAADEADDDASTQQESKPKAEKVEPEPVVDHSEL